MWSQAWQHADTARNWCRWSKNPVTQHNSPPLKTGYFCCTNFKTDRTRGPDFMLTPTTRQLRSLFNSTWMMMTVCRAQIRPCCSSMPKGIADSGPKQTNKKWKQRSSKLPCRAYVWEPDGAWTEQGILSCWSWTAWWRQWWPWRALPSTAESPLLMGCLPSPLAPGPASGWSRRVSGMCATWKRPAHSV